MKKLFGLLLLVACSKVTPPNELRPTGLMDSPAKNTPVIQSYDIRKKVADVDILAKRGSDRTAPVISITSPLNNATLSGPATVSASASDNIAVSSVSFYIDDVLIQADNTSPYNCSWNTTLSSNGAHIIKATAKDAAGNTKTNSIGLTVNNSTSLILNMPPVLSQGSEGSCVGFAVAYYCRSGLEYYKLGSSRYDNSVNVFSPEYLFDQIKSFDDCTGSPLITGLEYLKTNGVCTFQTMPYDGYSGCNTVPNNLQQAEAAKYKISSYNAIYATDITAIKSMILSKSPVIIPINIDDNFFMAGPGYIWDTYNGFWNSHVITICGFDDSKHAYKAVNSWGTSWGSGGYIWIDYDLLPVVCYQAFVMKL